MNRITGQIALPSIGRRSPILRFYRVNLRLAYYLTNFGLLALILGIFGYVKYQEWRLEMLKRTTGRDNGPLVIEIPYLKLDQPRSIMPDDFREPVSVQKAAGLVIYGVPKPVRDEDAIAITSPDQTNIMGNVDNNLASKIDSGQVVIKVKDDIPSITDYIAYDIPPKPIVQRPPVYPPIATKVGMEGTVFVKLLLDLDGTVMRVAVVRSSGCPQLDTAAVQCVLDWKFSPAIQNNRPVMVWLGSNIKFKLQ
jgi:TonB family protein